MARALHFLGERARSVAEVRAHLLHRGAPATVIDTVVEKLHDSNFLNDREFVRGWALARVEKGYGPARIDQELKAKGIDDRIIAGIVNEIFAAEREKETARKVLQRRFQEEDLRDSRVLRRAAGYLERRGFSSHVIGELLGDSSVDSC